MTREWGKQIVLHGYQPGSEPERIRVSVEASGWEADGVGIEADVIQTKRTGVCIGARDLKYREPLHVTIQHLREAGLGGFVFLDLIQRRAYLPAMQLLSSVGYTTRTSLDTDQVIHIKDPRVVMSMDQMILFFHRPGHEARWKTDPAFDRKRLVVLGMWRDVAQAYAGHADILQWEPTGDGEHRASLLKVAGHYPHIFYKTPWDTFNAGFDQGSCAEDDYRGFLQAGILSRVIPFGSLDNINRLRERWDQVKG